MDTLYPHHRQDAVAIVQARSNEAGESTEAGGTHPSTVIRRSLLSCSYGGGGAGIFVWRLKWTEWDGGTHLFLSINICTEYIQYESYEPWFCLQINLPVTFTHWF